MSLWNWITAFTATLARRPPVVGAGGAPSFVGAAPMHTECAKAGQQKGGLLRLSMRALHASAFDIWSLAPWYHARCRS